MYELTSASMRISSKSGVTHAGLRAVSSPFRQESGLTSFRLTTDASSANHKRSRRTSQTWSGTQKFRQFGGEFAARHRKVEPGLAGGPKRFEVDMRGETDQFRSGAGRTQRRATGRRKYRIGKIGEDHGWLELHASGARDLERRRVSDLTAELRRHSVEFRSKEEIAHQCERPPGFRSWS